jgi:hypothetical protein
MAASSSITSKASRVGLIAFAVCVTLASTTTLHAQQSALDTIRSDVREGLPPAPPSNAAPSTAPSANPSQPVDAETQQEESSLILAGAIGAGLVVSSPFWAPHTLLDDNYSTPEYFTRYPYANTPGYLVDPGSQVPTSSFAVRLDADYVEAFDHLDLINGHILVSTTSRIEFDARIQHLGETMPGGPDDELWIGDCNVMFRFAQASFAQFRAGLGINWLNDPSQTDLGFNFAYGVDLFPVKPLILSTVLDAGTLGHAGLFRLRSTAGVAYKRLEFYTGYEYTDIGRTHWNGLIGGVRLWF